MYYFKDIILQIVVNNCVVLYNIKLIISPEYPDIKPTMSFKSDQINEYNHNIIQYNVDKYLSSYFLYNGVIYETIVFFEVFIIILYRNNQIVYVLLIKIKRIIILVLGYIGYL